MARGTRIQPGWNGSQTTTDRGAPNNSSAVTIKYTPPIARQGALKALVANIQEIAKTAGKHTVEAFWSEV